MFTNALGSVRRSIPTIAIAGVLVAISATSGATAALVITGNDIKNGTVTTKDIKNDNLTSKDIKSGSLKTSDFKGSTVDDLTGATGPAGPAGAPGVSGYQIVTASAVLAPETGGEVTATCPTGKKVLGAAAELVNSYMGTAATIDISATRATAYGLNINPDAPDTLKIDVVCAVVS
ncbi:hypothetical protein [uncultured Nocardioides sp.]|uniref:hypothetical protein n=1 Tax=uncultured Nocardioides sp. TaxID=198441 RepID=UPI0026283542|nr:hypothetical protein [uncultured Nocardioides sp.]